MALVVQTRPMSRSGLQTAQASAASIMSQPDEFKFRPTTQEGQDLENVKPHLFDPLRHNPLRYDIFGMPKKHKNNPHHKDDRNILKDEIKVPEWWSPKRDLTKDQQKSDPLDDKERMTLTKLKLRRKLEKRPDMTFDLDGDGVVNDRDLMLATKFDKDGDGRLNTAERHEAKTALESGIEQNYLWGVEQTGGLKEHIRVLQKRGKICVGEDFGPVSETYPVHPLSQEPRRHLDKNDMMKKRKEGVVEEMEAERKLWELANPYYVDRVFIKPEGYVENPLYQSIKQKREQQRRNIRVNEGLTAEQQDIGGDKQDPTVSYVTSPKFNCKSQLQLQRKKVRQAEAKINQAKMDGFIDMRSRYLERESFNVISAQDEMNRSREHSQEEGILRTKTALLKKRKQDFLHYNMQTFADKVPKLPKYSLEEGEHKKWWTKQAGYDSNPNFSQSAKELMLRRKLHNNPLKQPEAMIIADCCLDPPPLDPFKTVHVPKPPQSNGQQPCTDKVTNVFKPMEEEVDYQPPQDLVDVLDYREKKNEQNERFTKFEVNFPRGETKVKRLFSNLQMAQTSAADFRPVPSSFKTISGVYRQQSPNPQIQQQQIYQTAQDYGNDPITHQDVRKSHFKLRSHSVQRPMTQQTNVFQGRLSQITNDQHPNIQVLIQDDKPKKPIILNAPSQTLFSRVQTVKVDGVNRVFAAADTISKNSGHNSMSSTQMSSAFNLNLEPSSKTLTAKGGNRVKPPLKQRHMTPAPTQTLTGNNFRVQTAKGIRSNAFINFSASSTNLTSGKQSRLKSINSGGVTIFS